MNLFVQCIAGDPDADETTRAHYMLTLLRGAGNELKKLGQRGVIIDKIYARSRTPTGIAMAMHMGMETYTPLPKTGKLIRFVLDVKTSDTYFAQKYKEGFADWKQKQSNTQASQQA